MRGIKIIRILGALENAASLTGNLVDVFLENPYGTPYYKLDRAMAQKKKKAKGLGPTAQPCSVIMRPCTNYKKKDLLR